MEINFFRLAVYKSWRRTNRPNAASADDDGAHGNTAVAIAMAGDGDDDDDDDSLSIASNSSSSSSSSAVGHLLNDVTSALDDSIITPTKTGTLPSDTQNTSSGSTVRPRTRRRRHTNEPSLQAAYNSIRRSSMQAIASSLIVYSLTAIGISLNTRGLDAKVISILIGASQFMTALMVFIVSAKVPQWIGFYHQGAIRLVKCSSNYSQNFEQIDLRDEFNLKRLRSYVRLGVWFHFAKFYIVLMPFYCGVQKITIPLSIVCGALFGFWMMWAVFVVHAKYIHHRNIVSFSTILILSIISALTFTRGMAWIQVIWKLNILKDEDALLVISFFAWLGVLALVHALFIWHTLRTEERNTIDGSNNNQTDQEGAAATDNGENGLAGNEVTGKLTKTTSSPILRRLSSNVANPTLRRNSSYCAYVFDPRTHFVDGKCQFSDHPVLEDAFEKDRHGSIDSNMIQRSQNASFGGEEQPDAMAVGIGNNDGEDSDHFIETPVAADGYTVGKDSVMEVDQDEIYSNACCPNNTTNGDGRNNPNKTNNACSSQDVTTKRKHCCRPTCCEVFICNSPEYKQLSRFWRVVCWIKIIVIALAYLLFLYFVIVSICATDQIASTRAGLPAVQEEIYNHMNEGPVCAFDNRGANSNITTFEDKEAAHGAGFMIVHCGACGACSSWDNLRVEYITRDNMASLANSCAKKSLFGGDDALTECLMEPEIGFGEECAICWSEDIICTKKNCVFIFLQSQMINNVGNFAVGENEITSASCEEAHCEVGQFVPCSGATRRRMNITSSISRPGQQQCAIVDVDDWDDLFFGSGIA